MAEPTPFQPTIEDLTSLTTGQPTYGMVANGMAMGADPMPKPPIAGPMNMAALPWWLAPFMFGLGRGRGRGAMPVAGGRPQMAAPPTMGSRQPRRMISANDNARDPNVDMPMLNTGNQSTMSTGGPGQSHVGRLNALNPQQFQVYLDARSRGMSPVDAMAAAQGAQ